MRNCRHTERQSAIISQSLTQRVGLPTPLAWIALPRLGNWGAMRSLNAKQTSGALLLLSVAVACSTSDTRPQSFASAGQAGSSSGAAGASGMGTAGTTGGGSGGLSGGGPGGMSEGGTSGLGDGGLGDGGSGAISDGGSGAISGGTSGGGSAGLGGGDNGGSSGASAGAGGSGTGGGSGTSVGGTSGRGGDAGSSGGGATGGEGGTVEECIVPTDPPGAPTVFNDDGGWCWYQDERAIVDTDTNRLIFASVATGGPRNGNIEASIYDLDSGGSPSRSTLGDLNPDDQNAPALLKLGPGRYVAMYTTHNDDCFSYYNLFDGGSWGEQQRFDWGPFGCPTPTSLTVGYSNLWRMGDEFYNFARSVETSPNLLTSPDGDAWSYAGRLTAPPTVGYFAGYYKYWGNTVDRIDFVGTEAHPRDNDNSLYHGYIQNDRSYNSFGEEIDGDIRDGNAPDIAEFTPVFATGSLLGSVSVRHLWNHDLVRYDDGTIVVLFQGRADSSSSDPDHRFGYARFDGSGWRSTYLMKGGHKLYDSEQDFTGLGALHPNSPYTIYVSTTVDPRDDSTITQKHEIWRGTTCDEGATFTWTAITENSAEDNLRPVVPFWDSPRTVLLWMRGTYNTSQTYDTDIVGLILDGR